MVRARLSTSLTAALLSVLVLLLVLVAGTFGLNRLSGGAFGAPPADPAGPVIVFEAEIPPDAPTGSGTEAPLGDPAPAPTASPDLPAPSANPAPTPIPAPVTPIPSPTIPAVPPLGGLEDTSGTVVELTASTVNSLGSTVGDTLGTVLALLGPPRQEPASVSAPALPTTSVAAGPTAVDDPSFTATSR